MSNPDFENMIQEFEEFQKNKENGKHYNSVEEIKKDIHEKETFFFPQRKWNEAVIITLMMPLISAVVLFVVNYIIEPGEFYLKFMIPLFAGMNIFFIIFALCISKEDLIIGQPGFVKKTIFSTKIVGWKEISEIEINNVKLNYSYGFLIKTPIDEWKEIKVHIKDKKRPITISRTRLNLKSINDDEKLFVLTFLEYCKECFIS